MPFVQMKWPVLVKLLLTIGIWTSVGLWESNAETPQWPTDVWPTSTPEAQGIDSKLLADMLDEIGGLKSQIESVTVIRNGHMVLDAYFQPFQKGRKHHIFSCTKSVMSALIGIAIQQGHIASVQTPVIEFFPQRRVANLDTQKQALTLEHLLTMTTGLDCRDSYRHQWVGLSAMLDSPDWTQHVLDLSMIEQPGQRFEYCNGASFLLAAILEHATGMNTLEYARKHLFGPLGIKDVSWGTSSRGINVGYAKMWLQPHDMAKIGLLYLNNGKWDGRQIVPANWVAQSTQAQVQVPAGIFSHYGYQWWVDSNGIYSALGSRGQYIMVAPTHHLVAVFTGDLPGSNISEPRRYLKSNVIAAIASNSPLPENPQQQARITNLITKYGKPPIGGYVWTTPDNGVAQNGLFMRIAAPALQILYPKGSRKEAKQDKTQIMRMKSPDATSFSGTILDIPEGVPLSEIGPKTYVALLATVGRNMRVLSNEPLILSDGSNAYLTTIKWKFRGIPLRTAVVSAFKSGKLVLFDAHVFSDLSAAIKIVSSLTFKKTR